MRQQWLWATLKCRNKVFRKSRHSQLWTTLKWRNKAFTKSRNSSYTELNCRIVSSSETTALILQNFNSLLPEKPFWHLFTISTSSCKSLVAQYVCVQQKLKKPLCMNYHRDLAGVWLWHPCKYQHKLVFCKPIWNPVQKPKFQFYHFLLTFNPGKDRIHIGAECTDTATLTSFSSHAVEDEVKMLKLSINFCFLLQEITTIYSACTYTIKGQRTPKSHKMCVYTIPM